MKENVIITNCKVSAEAYQLLAMLRKKPEGKGFKISHGALVKKDAGKLTLEDSFVADSARGSHSLTGGIIGGLVGLLTGPVGALVTGGLGAMIGNYMDKEESKDTYMALEKIGESLSDGDTAVLLLATEQDESALAEELKDFQVSITRMDTFNHTMQRMWVNFAKTGDPSLTAEESPTGKAIKWELYNSDTKPVMIFDEFNIHQSTEGDYGIVDWERTYPLTKYYIF